MDGRGIVELLIPLRKADAFGLMCYQNAWMKSREPFNGPRVTKLREEGTPQQKLLLGAIPKW